MTTRLRFNRRVRIIPHVWANLGKRGLNSFSVGRRGARLTLGYRRTRATIGFPGTGLFLTQEEPTRQAHAGTGFMLGVVIAIVVIMGLIVVSQ